MNSLSHMEQLLDTYGGWSTIILIMSGLQVYLWWAVYKYTYGGWSTSILMVGGLQVYL